MPTVGPIRETHVPVVYDTDSGGFGGPLDMNGPLIGMVAYTGPGGNLNIKIDLEFGQPGTKYEVFLVGGPAHALATGFIVIGALTTNGVGAGSGAFTVAHATLVSPPFGPGYRNDHIDMLAGVGVLNKGGLTAGAINYFVCREQGQPGHVAAEAHKGAIGKGDPHGDKAHQAHQPDTASGKKG